jgi:DNA topoisomerase-1
LQQETKFHRLYEFGKALPCIREQLEKDLSQPGFPESKVLAMVVSLMERTYIRVGNSDYEKRYGSYGLTTLKNKHVNVQGNTITFSFKGKKGVYHKITLKSKRFARIIKQCKAIPGSELFQYYDDSGTLHKVDSGQVNHYLKNCSDQDFTTKDFRTWAGSLMMLRILKDLPPSETAGELQKNIVDGFKAVSKELGNTVAVCKKYYVHPELITLYQARELEKFVSTGDEEKEQLKGDERMLMNVLRLVQREKFHPKLTEKLLKASIRKQKKALAA